MNLRVAGIGEAGAALVGAPTGRDVGTAGVGGQVVDVAIAAGGENDRIGAVPGDFACLQVADDDALGVAIDHHQIEHFGVGMGVNPTRSNHLVQRRISAQQKLLTRLAPGVKGAGNLCTAEGPVV